MAVKWVYEGIPVFNVALILTLILPVNSLIAFFTSKNNFNIYNEIWRR
jgi:hypothetical protein